VLLQSIASSAAAGMAKVAPISAATAKQAATQDLMELALSFPGHPRLAGA
jgi:hypothetical protein